jgi:protein TonB
MTRAADFDHRFGAALALSLVLHLGAMTLSPSSPKAPSFNPQVPLSVQLVREPVPQAAQLARPAGPATRPTRAKPAPPRHEKAPLALTAPAQALPPVDTIQPVPALDEAPAGPLEPPVPPPITASPQSAPEPEALARYAKSLSEVFARYKEYPRIAELRGWEGSVTMRLRVAPSGRLIAAELYESSGYDALDKQAMRMVTRVGVLPVPPEGLNAAEVPVLVPINFRLER